MFNARVMPCNLRIPEGFVQDKPRFISELIQELCTALKMPRQYATVLSVRPVRANFDQGEAENDITKNNFLVQPSDTYTTSSRLETYTKADGPQAATSYAMVHWTEIVLGFLYNPKDPG